MGGERPVRELHLDGELTIAEANVELHRLLRHFAPFGIGNPGPVFASFDVRTRGAPRIVGKNHLKVTLASDGATLGAIGFGMADRLDEISGTGTRVDVAYRLEENEWRGSRVPRTGPEVQARLLDIRKAE
jgi:single-stranded-DNA-specific exonuclease